MQIEELRRLSKTAAFQIDMKDAFFEAMNAGYAATEKPKKGSIVELPGSKMIQPYVRGQWKVTDVYLTTPLGTRSGGMTIISHECVPKDVPVWMMQYFGEYDEVAIPCLKAALRTAYGNGKFVGGRGLESFSYDDEFAYTNTVIRHGFYNLFNGEEKVYRIEDGWSIGWHVYQGGPIV